MKSSRRLGPNGPALGLIGGYGGSLALVAAAGVVLLMPLFGEDGDGGGRAETGSTGAAPAAPAATVPAQRPEPGVTSTSAARRRQGSTPQSQEEGGGGPPMPGQGGGGTLTWCPDGTAFYRDAVTGTGLEVTINVSASGLARAEVTPRGRAAVSRQATVRRPGPHTFRFAGLSARAVERVKVTTVSVGVAMQTCYARPGA
jgi:hypothetical protein